MILLSFFLQCFYFIHARDEYSTTGNGDEYHMFFPAQSCVEKFEFRVNAGGNVFIHLGRNPVADFINSYEIIIGGWQNTMNVIKRNINPTTPITVAEARTPGILTHEGYQGFWVRWDQGLIAVGKEGELMPFMAYEDKNPFIIEHIGARTGYGYTGGWQVDAFQTGGKRQQYRFYPVESSVKFRVRAQRDVFISLVGNTVLKYPMYEIIIGGWDNTKSLISKYGSHPVKIEVNTPYILDADSFRGFTVSWQFGIISVSKEGQAPFMTWKDPNPFPVEYIGFNTERENAGEFILKQYSNCTQDKLLEFSDQQILYIEHQDPDYRRLMEILWYGTTADIPELKVLNQRMAWRPNK